MNGGKSFAKLSLENERYGAAAIFEDVVVNN
jgi:hypothetical protein